MTKSSQQEKIRICLIIQGRVQGVGFRPFVWRLAKELSLTGFVKNTSAGVRLEAQGSKEKLEELENRLSSSLPPLARVTAIERDELTLVEGEKSFDIAASAEHAGQNVLVSPDIGLCEDCLDDIRNPDNFRHAYPFTNCVNCGPRFSITRHIPYDRKSTVMSCFQLCERCEQEYTDPSNRRFHAQPIACPECGPAIWYLNKENITKGESTISEANMKMAIERAGKDILAGKIVAVKGLGGFQLACDARNTEAVSLLRKRKNRPHKALAVMARDLTAVQSFCAPGDPEIELLISPEKPIVLCAKKSGGDLSNLLAPDTPRLGVMLPYTPLHALVFDWLHEHGLKNPVLVMTSANPSGEPICLGNREAIERLKPYADSWLLHNRDILVRVDDSVVSPGPVNISSPIVLRRARGYVPVPQKLPSTNSSPCVLGTGGDLKSAFCVIRSNEAFSSQHIGDLENIRALNFYEESLEHLESLLECKPELIVRDLHPDFASTEIARKLAKKYNVPLLPLQHHAAHAASVLAENMFYSPALALCLDGTGLGEDGTIWGGELIFMDLSKPLFERAGSFTPFPLPGGEKAIQEPWRISLAMKYLTGDLETLKPPEKAVVEMLQKGINCPETSSCGRLFDAISARLGLCEKITYEGQAAIRLMNAAWPVLSDEKIVSHPKRSWLSPNADLPMIDSRALFSACSHIYDKTKNRAKAAAAFHMRLSDSLVELCQKAANKYQVRHVALSGGVMQNSLLLSLLNEKLSEAKLRPLWHKELPCGDGGLAFGQAVWGRQMFISGKIPH